MASEVSIVNAALTYLGQPNIGAFTDSTREARLATRDYADIRDDLLREHPWGWATKRASLAASATSPTWEFSNAYVPPADFLRLVEVNDADQLGSRMEMTDDGPVIVTDISAPLEIAYVAQVTNVAYMEPKFRTALSAECAARWAEALTGNDQLRQDMVLLAAKTLRDAKGVEGQEDTFRVYDPTTWTDARW